MAGRGAERQTLAARIVAPAVPSSFVARPALERRLEAALERRLTAVVAAAGFGKSTLLAAWAARVNCAWYAAGPVDADVSLFVRGLADAVRLRVPALSELAGVVAARGPDSDDRAAADAAAGLLCEALAEHLRRDLVLVVDDVHELGDAPGPARLLAALCREAPRRVHLVLASRAEPPFATDRLRGQGQLLELGAADLAFTEDEIAVLLAAEIDNDATEFAPELHAATGGWPAAVRLAIETLHGVAPAARRDSVRRLLRPGGTLFAYVAAEVFDREPREVRDLVRTASLLDGFTPELLTALGVERAAESAASLSRRGLFLELRRTGTGWISMSDAVRDFVREHDPRPPSEVDDVRRRAAAWLAEHDFVQEALEQLTGVGAVDEIARLLEARGRELLRAGALGTVVRAGALVPAPFRSAQLEQIEGTARQIRGDWEGALACFRRIAARDGQLDPDVAWRLGLIHHFRGRLDEALAVYGRARLDGDQPSDEALVLAWAAGAHWLRGETDACRSKAERALAIATEVGDPQSLATSHTALAMLAATDGDRAANDAHYLRALEHAERAGDLPQTIRIHVNRASLFIEEGAYAEGLAELSAALPLAEVTGFASFRALGLTNRGEAQFRLGRLEEAVRDLEDARAIYQRIGARMVAYPLQKLGDVYTERGDLALARAAYEEAIAHAEPADDRQALAPALAGLARVLAREEPEAAAAHAARALALGPGIFQPACLCAAAAVAIEAGDLDRSAALAEEAAAAARARRDRPGLAEALELQGLAGPSPERVHDARRIWQEVGSPIGVAHAELVLARLAGDAALAARAEAALRALGAHGPADEAAALLAELEQEPRPPVEMRTLGAFRVLRRGVPVPLADWQSRKARDLVKILIARRGRPTPRDLLMEALWPEDDPRKLGNRLSVALATARSVLDPDKEFPPEHFLAADKNAVRVDLETLQVDVEAFLAKATAAAALAREGRSEEAAAFFASAESTYTGDFLEEDLYEDWAATLRDEARAAYVQVARALADGAAARGDGEAAARYLLRILERDRYDEPAHLALVSTLETSGRHGEARRFFRTYCARMEEIGVEPAPFAAATAA